MGRGAAVFHHDEEDAVQDQHGGNGDVVVEAGLEPVVQRADDQHRQGGGHHLEPELPDLRLGGHAAVPQPEGPELVPEQDHHREDGTQLDDHAEHGHELFTCIELDELLHKDHVTGGRDGQPLGDALHNAHQDGFQNFKKHRFPPSPAHRGTPVFCRFQLRLSVYHIMRPGAREIPKFYLHLRLEICYTGTTGPAVYKAASGAF